MRGVKIYYRGKLADMGQIRTISDELIATAERMNWKWISLDEDWEKPSTATVTFETAEGFIANIEGHLPLKGVSFMPERAAGPLKFFFDSEGNLRSPLDMAFITEGRLKPEEAWINTDMHASPPETDLWVASLMRYLKERYIPDLEVYDDGGCLESELVNGRKCFLDESMNRELDELSPFSNGHIFESSLEEVDSMVEEMVRGLMRSAR